MPSNPLVLLLLWAALLFVLLEGSTARPFHQVSTAHANMTYPLKVDPGPRDPSLPIPPTLLPQSVTLKDHHITIEPFRLNSLSATLHFTALEGGYLITLSHGSISSIHVEGLEGESSPLLEGVTFEGTLFWSLDENYFRIHELAFHLPPEGIIKLEGTYGFAQGALEGRLLGSGLDLSHTFARLFSLPPDFHLAFLLDTHMHVERKGGGPFTWRGEGSVSGLEFHTPQFIHAGENLEAHFHFSGWREPTGGATQLELELQMTEGECLFDKLYFDLAQTPLHLFMDAGIPSHAPSSVHLEDLRLSLHSIFDVHTCGSLQWEKGEISTNLQFSALPQPLEPMVHKFIREPHGERLPGLDQMDFGGRWAGAVHVQGPLGAPHLSGRMEILEGSVRDASRGIHVEGMSVNLPFDLTASEEWDARPATQPAGGHIQVQEFRTPLLHLRAFQLPFQSFPNGYRLMQSTTIPAERGFIRILELEMRDLPFSHRTGEMSLRISQLGLDNFLEALFTEELAATLHGEELQLNLLENRLESSGSLFLDTFAGEVIIEAFGVNGVVSPFRSYTLDARWDDLDLDKLTRLTDFGRVTGHVRGHLKNLEMAGGMPVSFDLAIESLPRRLARRVISVTAVENLTELSGGGSPFVGVGGIMAFLFKTFRYEEIGIACYLENDFFTIRGTIVRDDQEYLVRRGWLGGINIINRHPDNRISWNDMLRRIQRIQRESPHNSEF